MVTTICMFLLGMVIGGLISFVYCVGTGIGDCHKKDPKK